MRIIHLSDSHLGYTAYRQLNAEGYNLRGEDICLAFRRAIDKVLELRPDIVLHTGDLFDSSRPLNRIVELAYTELMRLKKQGIPVILLAGNHETPKQKNIGHVFALWDVFHDRNSDQPEIDPGQIYAVYRERYERLTYKDICFHAVPQCADQEALEQELKKITLLSGKKNVGLFHAGVAGLKEFRQGDFNEQLLKADFLSSLGFDYCALGHLHRMVEAGPRAWYAGSTERLSFNELDQQKGFLEVDLNTGRVDPHYLQVREMRETEENVSGLSAEQVFLKLQKVITGLDPKGKILRVKVQGISPEVQAILDFRALRSLTEDAVHSEFVFEQAVPGAGPEAADPVIRGLAEEFAVFCGQHVPQDKQEIIRQKGLKLLQEAMED